MDTSFPLQFSHPACKMKMKYIHGFPLRAVTRRCLGRFFSVSEPGTRSRIDSGSIYTLTEVHSKDKRSVLEAHVHKIQHDSLTIIHSVFATSASLKSSFQKTGNCNHVLPCMSYLLQYYNFLGSYHVLLSTILSTLHILLITLHNNPVVNSIFAPSAHQAN